MCVQVPKMLVVYCRSCSAVDGCAVPLEIWNGFSNSQRWPRTVKVLALEYCMSTRAR